MCCGGSMIRCTRENLSYSHYLPASRLAVNKLLHDRSTWIQPDVSFIRAEQIRLADPDGYLEHAPEVAVEIASLDESAEDMERKIDVLLASGTLIVWMILPQIRSVRVIHRDG